MIAASPPFHVELIKPSRYDDDGYVVQWREAFVPSNSLASLYALVADVDQRKALGADRALEIHAYDECHTVIPVKRIISRLRAESGIVFMVGVQSNQFPRALDLARQFRSAGIPVVIGGFHVSGSKAMLPEAPPELLEALALGVTLFAGEAEGRMEGLLGDALRGELAPQYDYLTELPELENQVIPILPEHVIEGYQKRHTSFDAGRGCPFNCSFCTIINVQGRKSRWRSADDVERIVRSNVANGRRRFFITDDDFARNANWEPIFDRLIELREREGIKAKFIIQVDTQSYKIPHFVEKAARAGCNRVFLGLENINPANLKSARKFQNKITDYRSMLLAWRSHKILTYAGYILGFPEDTPESIANDIEVIKRELPIDLLEFFVLTPLPGSADHKALHLAGTWMDPDMNKYDLEHVTTAHPKMTPAELAGIYERAWHLYYTPEHLETLMRRAEALGSKAKTVGRMAVQFYGMVKFEKVHPLQGGLFRRKVRTHRRPSFPRENPVLFYPKRAWQCVATYFPFWRLWRQVEAARKRIEADPRRKEYTDQALTPVQDAVNEDLELFSLTPAAQETVAFARTRAAARTAEETT